jgi:hypothetical protein
VIADRTTEHLGPTDMGVIRFRRLIMEAVRALETANPRAPSRIRKRIESARAVRSHRPTRHWPR